MNTLESFHLFKSREDQETLNIASAHLAKKKGKSGIIFLISEEEHFKGKPPINQKAFINSKCFKAFVSITNPVTEANLYVRGQHNHFLNVSKIRGMIKFCLYLFPSNLISCFSKCKYQYPWETEDFSTKSCGLFLSLLAAVLVP